MSTKTMNATINKLKKANENRDILATSALQNKTEKAAATQSNTQKNNVRQRASGNKVALPVNVRKSMIEDILKGLLLSEISQGEALINLRVNILGLKQDDYAKLVKLSRKTISDIENNKGNSSEDVLNKAFKPFGLKAGLVPVSPSILKNLISQKSII